MEPKAEKVRRAAVAVIARVRDALIPEGEVRLFHDRQAVKDLEDLLRRVIQAPVAKEEAQPARGEIIAMRPRKPIDVSRDPYRVFGTTPSAPFNERTRRERTINLREHESLGLAVTPARAHVRADILADLDLCTDRKSTRLNSSHSQISYAVFCLKKKKNKHIYIKDNNTHITT